MSTEVEEVNCGIPQGSCLGPLFFLSYINDLLPCIQSSEATTYADDTAISYSFKTVGELNAKLNNGLHCLEEWSHGNRLAISVIKTQTMIVGSRPNLRKSASNALETPCFVIVGTNIDFFQSVKYLGVMLDEHLVWDEHITLLQTKISRSLSFLKYATKFLPFQKV